MDALDRAAFDVTDGGQGAGRDQATERKGEGLGGSKSTLGPEAFAFRRLVDALPHPVFTARPDGACDFVNTPLSRYTGRSPEHLFGDGWLQCVHPSERAKVSACWKVVLTDPTAFQADLRVLGRDGRFRWFSVDLRPVLDGQGRLRRWVGSMTDIDESRRASEALTHNKARENLIAEVSDSIRDVVWIGDATQRRTLYINSAYERIWGRSVDALYARNADWIDAVHDEDRARVQAATSKQASGTYDEEYRIVRPDGAIRWIRDRAYPVRDETGAVTRIVGVAEDITERRELEAQLRATQNMETVGQLAGGLAHDFNNILTVIIACTDEVLRDIAATSPAREPLLETRLAVQRASSLTRDLLAFSRRHPQEPKVLDLNDVVSEADRMLRRLLGEDLLLTTQLAKGIAPVRIDRAQLTSVLLNLAVNARHAMPRGGVLSIRTFETAVPRAADQTKNSLPPALAGAPHYIPGASGRATLPAGAYVVLEVTDSGIGLGPEVAHRIFEPFFTTKGAGKGTGLGLSVVHGVVKQSGGQIEVVSQPGVGTSFRIYLPSVEAGAALHGESVIPELRGTETILLVEDEACVRRAAMRVLSVRGFRVLSAGDAEEALKILEAEAGAVDVLVTDIVLPKMHGPSLVEHVRTSFPKVKILYTSGYHQDDVSRYGFSSTNVAFLEKPYTPRSFVRKLRQVIDGVS